MFAILKGVIVALTFAAVGSCIYLAERIDPF